jgi:hypothetical protein
MISLIAVYRDLAGKITRGSLSWNEVLTVPTIRQTTPTPKGANSNLSVSEICTTAALDEEYTPAAISN